MNLGDAWGWTGLDLRLRDVTAELAASPNVKRRALAAHLAVVADALEAVRKHEAGDIGQCEEVDAIMLVLRTPEAP